MISSVDIGFMPLVDASVIIAAHELGFARDEGVELNLIRESSWANIRDRMVVGHFQAAHMLAPLPIAGMLGLNYRNTTLGRDFQIPAPEGDRANFVVLREGPNPIYGMVTKDFLVRMNADGSNATLHDLHSDTPKQDVAAEHPEVFDRLFKLARGQYETARYMFYDNVDE